MKEGNTPNGLPLNQTLEGMLNRVQYRLTHTGDTQHTGSSSLPEVSQDQLKQIEDMAQWAPHRTIAEEQSFGRLDLISNNPAQRGITNFIKRHAERMASTLDLTLEEYVASLPEIPDSEASGFQPFFVDPRFNSGAFNIHTGSGFEAEQEIERVFEEQRSAKPRIEWGRYIRTEDLEYLIEQGQGDSVDSFGLRHANVQDLLFAHEQYIKPEGGFDYLFAGASRNHEGTARLDSSGHFVFGAYEDGLVGKHNKRFNLFIKEQGK